MYIIKGNNNKNELIIGKEELEKYSIEDIKNMYGVDKVTILPPMDYHIDLFIRPLDNKRILLADDNLTLKTLDSIYDEVLEYQERMDCRQETVNKINSGQFDRFIDKFCDYVNKFEQERKNNPFPQADEVEEILQNAGYEVIRVPGRIYDVVEYETSSAYENMLQHKCNYMNAQVLKNKDGDLVYITNKSLVDRKIGLSKHIREKIDTGFEKKFVESISEYVKPEHIYFIEGEENFVAEEMLPLNQGGIHCACTEVPEL